MLWETIFVGIGATIIGTIVGSVLTAYLTHRFHASLLKQQLDFQRESQKEFTAFLASSIEEISGRLQQLSRTIGLSSNPPK